MDASHLRRDPGLAPDARSDEAFGEAFGDAFGAALLGLDSVCRYLALALDEAGQGAAGDARDPGADRAPDPAADRAPQGVFDEQLDALLGLVSVHRTVSLVLAAIGGDGVEPPEAEADAEAEAPAWSREVLR